MKPQKLTDTTILLIGGTGRMGNWLKNFLESQNLTVQITGRKYLSDKNLRRADIIFITVPIFEAANVIRSLNGKIKNTALIIDLTSTKAMTLPALDELANPGIGIHMLFGPTVSSIQGQKLIVSRVKDSPLAEQVLAVFVKAGADVIEMSGEDHDRTMSYVQSLIHFINIALADILLGNNIDLSGRVSTPVFINQIATTLRVMGQDSQLLSNIQRHNPNNKKVLAEFIATLQDLQSAINNKDENKLLSRIESLQSKIKPQPKIVNAHNQEPARHLLSKGVSVTYLGPVGTYSHQAALSLSHEDTRIEPAESLYDIFLAVKTGKTEFGVVPAENTTEGTIRETLDYLVDFDLRTNASVIMDIHHSLLSKERTLSKITRVISHPQALAQCRSWLRENVPQAKLESAASTLAAVQNLPENTGIAVIGPEIAANKYGLNLLASNIEDNKQNITKFYVISKGIDTIPINTNKTLLFLTIFNRIGILKDMLDIFASHGINLSKLESRPSKEKVWDYHFFIEVDVRLNDLRLQQALDMMKQYCPVIKVLGGI